MMIDRRRLSWMATASFLVSLLVAGTSVAQQPTIGRGEWYYQMGGAAPISPAPNSNAVSLLIEGSAGLQLPKACGSLDPTISISNTLGNVADGIDELDDLFVLAATEAIAALPALILQRANPGLYEHFQGALAQAQQLYDISVKSCERIVEDSANGRNPFEDWVTVSKRENYKEKISENDADAVAAETEVNEENGNKGTVWIGGENRGGLNQAPLEPNRDVVQAGYNVIVGQAVTATTAPAAAQGLRLTDLFQTPQDAGDFAVEVLGDDTIVTCEGCTSDSRAGVGLGPAYARESGDIGQQLQVLAADDTPTDPATLEDVSSVNIAVTPQLLSTLRDVDDDQDRAVLTARLAGDIATARTIERALSIRRLLYSGRGVPEVAANTLAQEHIETSLMELEAEIDAFLFEARVQKELASETAGIILREGERLATSAVGVPDGTSTNSGRVILRGEAQ